VIALQIAVAAALAAWWPPALPPPVPPEAVVPAAPVAPLAPIAPAQPAAAVPMIARPPLDVRVRPLPAVTAPAADATPAKVRSPLYKDWRFWAVAGSLFVGSVATTYAVTRPGPPAYTGNAPPYYVTFR